MDRMRVTALVDDIMGRARKSPIIVAVTVRILPSYASSALHPVPLFIGATWRPACVGLSVYPEKYPYSCYHRALVLHSTSPRCKNSRAVRRITFLLLLLFAIADIYGFQVSITEAEYGTRAVSGKSR